MKIKNSIKPKTLALTCFFLLLVIIGCGTNQNEGGDGGGSTEIGNPIIQGVVQKGPFIKGTSVIIEVLNDTDLSETGDAFITYTTDDTGTFEVFQTISANYIKAETKGYYFNEITGSLSGSYLKLKAFAGIDTGNTVNVNILTTLAAERIRYLVTQEGMTFTDAESQARLEILRIFDIPESIISTSDSFDEMDISQDGESNAILLAISVILQGENTVDEVQTLIADISDDITADGTLDDSLLIEEIEENRSTVDAETVRKNLSNRFSALGITTDIPEFEVFLDSDGDGTINYSDRPVASLTERSFTNQELAIHSGHASVIFQDKYFIIGGENNSGKSEVWILGDDDTFQLVTDNAPWAARHGHAAVVYNDRIWICGGAYNDTTGYWTYANDIWWSEDGSEWHYYTNLLPFPLSGHLAFVYDDQIWVIGGMMEYDRGDFRPSPYVITDWDVDSQEESWNDEELSSVLVNEVSYYGESYEKIWVAGSENIYCENNFYADYKLPYETQHVFMFESEFSGNGLTFLGQNETTGVYSAIFSTRNGDWQNESPWHSNEAIKEPETWPAFDIQSFQVFRDALWIIDKENKIWTIEISEE